MAKTIRRNYGGQERRERLRKINSRSSSSRHFKRGCAVAAGYNKHAPNAGQVLNPSLFTQSQLDFWPIKHN